MGLNRKQPISLAIRILYKMFYSCESIHAKSKLWAAIQYLQEQQNSVEGCEQAKAAER